MCEACLLILSDLGNLRLWTLGSVCVCVLRCWLGVPCCVADRSILMSDSNQPKKKLEIEGRLRIRAQRVSKVASYIHSSARHHLRAAGRRTSASHLRSQSRLIVVLFDSFIKNCVRFCYRRWSIHVSWFLLWNCHFNFVWIKIYFALSPLLLLVLGKYSTNR